MTVAKDHLKAFVERIERLEEERKGIAEDIRDVYAEAKASEFDVKALRAIVRLRKQDAQERAEHEAILESYMHALGMLADLPLGESAIKRAAEKAAASPAVQRAVKRMGKPAELTEKEKSEGYGAAFIGKDGTRVTIGLSTPTKPPEESESPPPAISASPPDDLTVPAFLRRGDPECVVQT